MSASMQSPRRNKTGKRGCPQQFPKKLYDMIEIESNVPSPIVTWTETGRAFRIVDVSQFTAKTLTMYFKTSKFSSFQRNLNLYGFVKIRKGVESDSYFHPRFSRGNLSGALTLRKKTAGSPRVHYSNEMLMPRIVSPTTSMNESVEAPCPFKRSFLTHRTCSFDSVDSNDSSAARLAILAAVTEALLPAAVID